MMDKQELYKAALNKAMRLCSQREYCIHDISDKTASWNIGKEETDKIIKILLNDKFIDEARYARAYARDKFTYNKWGKIKITASLKLRGIPVATINEAVGSLDEKTYRDAAHKIISSHRKKIKAKNEYDLKAKLLRYGLSKGFESSLLYEILGEDF